jgi:hypothetical protein
MDIALADLRLFGNDVFEALIFRIGACPLVQISSGIPTAASVGRKGRTILRFVRELPSYYPLLTKLQLKRRTLLHSFKNQVNENFADLEQRS